MIDLIAEVDPNGEIAWVWRRFTGERVARPVMPKIDRFTDLSRARVSGSSHEKVSEWLWKSGAVGSRASRGTRVK